MNMVGQTAELGSPGPGSKWSANEKQRRGYAVAGCEEVVDMDEKGCVVVVFYNDTAQGKKRSDE